MAKNNKNTSKNRMSDTVNKKPKMKKKKSSLKEKIIIAVSIIAAVIIIAVMVLNIPIIPVERTKDGLTYTEHISICLLYTSILRRKNKRNQRNGSSAY